eukprot:sb/3466871/
MAGRHILPTQDVNPKSQDQITQISWEHMAVFSDESDYETSWRNLEESFYEIQRRSYDGDTSYSPTSSTTSSDSVGGVSTVQLMSYDVISSDDIIVPIATPRSCPLPFDFAEMPLASSSKVFDSTGTLDLASSSSHIDISQLLPLDISLGDEDPEGVAVFFPQITSRGGTLKRRYRSSLSVGDEYHNRSSSSEQRNSSCKRHSKSTFDSGFESVDILDQILNSSATNTTYDTIPEKTKWQSFKKNVAGMFGKKNNKDTESDRLGSRVQRYLKLHLARISRQDLDMGGFEEKHWRTLEPRHYHRTSKRTEKHDSKKQISTY